MMRKIRSDYFFRVATFWLVIAALLFSPWQAARGFDEGLKQINNQITLLYIDALNFYKEGRYVQSQDSVAGIFDLLQGYPYLYSIRRKLEIQPDEITLQALMKRCQNAEAQYQAARQAFASGDYEGAEEIFLALQEESPQSQEIGKYIESLQNKSYLAVDDAYEEKAKQLHFQEEIAQRQKDINVRVEEIRRAVAQEKAITEQMLQGQKEDQTKIVNVQRLWRQARRLYKAGKYEEAIRYFEEIIEIEGNPRIKYTPAAKDYIEKAKEKIVEKEKSELEAEIERLESDMNKEVLQRQIPPYLEPPVRVENIPETLLVEPPVIRKRLKSPISLDFDRVDLKSVMAFLSQESGVNIIASQKVLDMGPKVSVRFSNTAVEEAIKYITKSLSLIYRIDKDIVWIAHPEEIAQEPLETRIYYLSKGGGLYTEFSPITSGSAETGLGGSSAQINKITTIEDTLKLVVPWPQDAKITYDKRINALVVRNTPQNLQMLEDIIYNLDVTPCQVLIEARFLEVDITDIEELGLEWKISNETFAFVKKGGSAKHGLAQESGVDFSTFSRVSEGLNLTYKGLLTAPQFQFVLHTLEETKKIKTLSSPRITTLNNQAATIKVVDEWIYPTRYEYEVVQTDLNGDADFLDPGETTYKNVPKDFIRRDVGILLKVIPSVGADRKTINLSLIPEVSEATADAFSYTGDVKLPMFTSRNLSTTVVVNSSDTVVLGGLIKENRTRITTKVPMLGDLPLLGRFFKKDTDSIKRKNLLIFVTAKVLSPSGEEMVMVPMPETTIK